MRQVSIVIPIFNAREDVDRLLTSLAAIYPGAGPTFVLADDCSSDPQMDGLYRTHPFLQRADVRLIRSEKNRGFVQNVNHAFTFVDAETDILLLNSDTVFFSDPIPRLQKEAYAWANVASVTPLTTNGTLASVVDWPNGGQFLTEDEARCFDQAVEALGLEGASVEVPTGVGFCMYIRHDARRALGDFDVAYGRGYGEECDWCQRALTSGWQNRLTPAAFVLHTGTKSFHSAEKQASIDRNTVLLLSRYPSYNQQVAKHFAQDPLGLVRVLLGIEWSRRLTGRALAFFTLHADPLGATAGGTEAHVREVIAAAAAAGQDAVVAFPTERDGTSGFYAVQVFHQGKPRFAARVHGTYFGAFLGQIQSRIGVVHLQHLRGWTTEAATLLMQLPCKKVLTLHDAYLLCPKVFIHHLPANGKTVPCTTLPATQSCSRCDGEFQGKSASLRSTRASFAEALFAHCDKVIFPSEYLREAFGNFLREPTVRAKAEVLHHDLRRQVGAMSTAVESPRREPQAKRICFLGDIGTHKGKAQLEQAVPSLEKRGFELRFLGRMAKGAEGEFWRRRDVRGFDGPEGLAVALREFDPDVIVTPSAVGETFGFTFYEALLLTPGRCQVVVGPYGNPAVVAQAEGVAQVMTESSANALLKAIDDAMGPVGEATTPRRRAFVEKLVVATRSASAAKGTVAFFTDEKGSSSPERPDGRRLVEAAFGSSATAFFDYFFLESQSKLGQQMQKLRRVIKSIRDFRDRSTGRATL